VTSLGREAKGEDWTAEVREAERQLK
jgi:hypothetical protein